MEERAAASRLAVLLATASREAVEREAAGSRDASGLHADDPDGAASRAPMGRVAHREGLVARTRGARSPRAASRAVAALAAGGASVDRAEADRGAVSLGQGVKAAALKTSWASGRLPTRAGGVGGDQANARRGAATSAVSLARIVAGAAAIRTRTGAAGARNAARNCPVKTRCGPRRGACGLPARTSRSSAAAPLKRRCSGSR